MALSREQERRRKAIFDDALENWRSRSASSTERGIQAGEAAALRSQKGIMTATRNVKDALTPKKASGSEEVDSDTEIANFIGGWVTAIDEAYGDMDLDYGEDSKAKKPPRITPEEVETGMSIPDFDIESDLDMAANALGFIESTNDYSALGDIIKNKNSMYYGDRAYGRYQVMGKNIPKWTKKYLGKQMTKEQFLEDTEAQDTLVRAFLTEEYSKHGTIEDAVSVWFTGRPLKKATAEGAADQNIPVNEYVSRFQKEFVKLSEG